jgi:predicted  nucleic acid-binding Zn-ribbon protein
MIEKNKSRKFLYLLEKRIYETNRDLEKVEDQLEALLVKKRQLHLHVIGICDTFACHLSAASETEKKKMSGFFYAVEGIWKRDRARLTNEIKQAEEKRKELNARLTRLVKKAPW